MYINIEKILEKRGMSKRELSEKTGIRSVRINKLVSGELDKITVKEIEVLCAVLNCKIEDIIHQ